MKNNKKRFLVWGIATVYVPLIIWGAMTELVTPVLAILVGAIGAIIIFYFTKRLGC